MISKSLGVLILLFASIQSQQYKSLNEVFKWRLLADNFYSAPIDVDVEYKRDGNRRVFTTIPKFEEGVPFTLATVSNDVGPNGPILYPYPSLEWHNNGLPRCMGIISAFRTSIDECNQMWVIDSGVEGEVQICPPKLLTFDLNTDQLIDRYHFPTGVYIANASLLITPAVDIRDPPPSGKCRRAMVYIADVDFPGLVVYDSERKTSWRIRNKLMYPDPDFGTHTIAGESFDLMDGIFTLNLTPRSKRSVNTRYHSPPVSHGDRNLFFHALAADTECSVSLRLIDNQTLWASDANAMPQVFRQLGRRGIQSAMETIDSKGNIFANTHDLRIVVWNIFSHHYGNLRTVANNPEQLQFASGMKIIKNPDGEEELWVLTNRFQKNAIGTMDSQDYNYRIMGCKTSELFSNNECSVWGSQTANSL